MFKNYSGSFWVLAFSSYLFFTSFTMIIAELPGYLTRLGGQQYLGLIVALFTLTAGLSRPFSGKLTDRWGRIPVMIIGTTMSAFAALLYPALTSVAGFLFIRLIHGFSTGFKPTGTSAYIADIVPKDKRGEALGISSFFGTIGMSSGPALGSWIFLEFGINWMFYVSSMFSIASILILITMKETLQERESFKLSLLKISKADIYEPAALRPSIVMVLTTLSFGTVITLAPDFSEYLDITNKGMFFIVFTGSSLLVRIIGGQLSDKYGRASVLKFSTSILFVSMLILGFSESSTQFYTGAFIFGLGYGLNSPTLFAWTIDLSSDKSRGRGISTLFIFLEIGIGMGALISGTIYQGNDGLLPIIFSCAGIFCLVAFGYLLLLDKKRTPQVS
ncbi:MAG: MFS transporter [Cyclobacteriaceae bacterium]